MQLYFRTESKNDFIIGFNLPRAPITQRIKKEGPSLMKRMEICKSFHQIGSLCIYHFGEKIVNFLDKVKNNDLDKVKNNDLDTIKIMVLTLTFHYTIIHFIEILGFGCRGMYPGKKGI